MRKTSCFPGQTLARRWQDVSAAKENRQDVLRVKKRTLLSILNLPERLATFPWLRRRLANVLPTSGLENTTSCARLATTPHAPANNRVSAPFDTALWLGDPFDRDPPVRCERKKRPSAIERILALAPPLPPGASKLRAWLGVLGERKKTTVSVPSGCRCVFNIVVAGGKGFQWSDPCDVRGGRFFRSHRTEVQVGSRNVGPLAEIAPLKGGWGGANACFVMGRELRRRHRTAMRAQLALAGLTASACPPTDTPLDCQRVSTNRHALSRILIPAHHLHREVQTHLDQHDGFHWLRHSPSPVAISTTAAICWPGPLNDALARVLVLRWRPI